MRLITIAKRRADGLVDSNWVEGFDAFRDHVSTEHCPYRPGSEEFDSWMEGWAEAADSVQHSPSNPAQ